MAKYGASSVGFILVGGRSLAGVISTLTYKVQTTTESTGSLGDAWAEATPVGVRSATLTQSGWFDDATNSVVTALVGNEATSQIVSVAPAGGTIGTDFTGFEGAFGGQVDRLIEKDALHKLNCTYTISGAVEDGTILHALGAETATGNSASQDQTASSSDGGSAYLQITAVSGSSPTLDAKVQHSADNSSWADLISMTQATALGAERKTVTGTVNRYVRANFTVGGSSPSFTFMLGFYRG